jgi:hypothetical protein
MFDRQCNTCPPPNYIRVCVSISTNFLDLITYVTCMTDLSFLPCESCFWFDSINAVSTEPRVTSNW